jgi:predicted CopG family antitoxin
MGLEEFNTTNIKIGEPTYKELEERKQGNETYDELIDRLLRQDQAMRELMREFDMRNKNINFDS